FSTYLLCCFFLQAEDGIRDRTVPGVQTCALPISGKIVHQGIRRTAVAHQTRSSTGKRTIGPLIDAGEIDDSAIGWKKLIGHNVRSEERRVGKECRCRWER